MNATRKFLKDLVLAGIGFGIMILLLSAGSGVNGSGDLFGCLMGSGVVFGWKYASKVLIAFSWWALLIKFLIAIVIGIFAMPITLIADIINIIREFRTARA